MGLEISNEEIMKDILEEVMAKVREKKLQAERDGVKFIEDKNLLDELFKKDN